MLGWHLAVGVTVEAPHFGFGEEFVAEVLHAEREEFVVPALGAVVGVNGKAFQVPVSVAGGADSSTWGPDEVGGDDDASGTVG